MAEQQQELIEFDDDLIALLEKVGDEHLPADRWPQVLADVIEVTRAALADRMKPDEARAAAIKIAGAWAQYMGGQQFYLPSGSFLRKALEHAAIWHAWDGRPATKYALAKAYNLTERRIEQIIAEQTALHRRRFQGSLFADE